MRVLLAGQKSFGLAAYEAIIDAGHDVVGVWSPFSDTDHGLRVAGEVTDKLSRRALEDKTWVPFLERTPTTVRLLEADLIVAAHSHDFISKQARAATRLGGIGYHPSLLPRHRGRDAVRWTVRMGDAVTGGTVYWLTDNVDGGPIAAQEHVMVPIFSKSVSMNEEDLVSWIWRERLFPLGIQLLLDVLFDLQQGTIVEVPQDEAFASWEPSWERPPLHRPDLIQIGEGVPGFRHVTTQNGAHTWRTVRDMRSEVS